MLDEVPVAFVIPGPGQPIEGNTGLTAAIMSECKSKLADFKRPRQVILVAELPRSTLEKVSKVDLRKKLPTAG